MKLHTKLGKPIPSTDPVVVSSATVATTTTPVKPPASAATSAVVAQKAIVSNPVKTQTPVKQAAAQKVSVIGEYMSEIHVWLTSRPECVNTVTLTQQEGSGFYSPSRDGLGRFCVEVVCSHIRHVFSLLKAASPEQVKKEVVMRSDPPSDGEGDACGAQADILPVGNDYVEEVRE